MILISNLIAILRKELQGYFASPLFYIIAAIFWLISGVLFLTILQNLIQGIAFQEQQGSQLPPIDLPYEVLSQFLGVIGTLSSFILPIFSMGLYAEERKRGTLELLTTSTIANWVIASGKLLGSIAFFSILIAPFLLYEAIAFSTSTPPISLVIPLLGQVSLILLAASILSLGMFISALTDSLILSAVLTFALVILLWIIDVIGGNNGGAIGTTLNHLSIFKHYNNFIIGVVDTSSIILFFSYIFLGIFLTTQFFKSLRYRRF
jgi:ABC-2 type transport system permease protein